MTPARRRLEGYGGSLIPTNQGSGPMSQPMGRRRMGGPMGGEPGAMSVPPPVAGMGVAGHLTSPLAPINPANADAYTGTDDEPGLDLRALLAMLQRQPSMRQAMGG